MTIYLICRYTFLYYPQKCLLKERHHRSGCLLKLHHHWSQAPEWQMALDIFFTLSSQKQHTNEEM